MIGTVLDGIKGILESNGFSIITKGDISGNKQASKISLRGLTQLAVMGEARMEADVEIFCFIPMKPTSRYVSAKSAAETLETLINALWDINNTGYAVKQDITATNIEDDGRVFMAKIDLRVQYRG